MRTKRTLLNMAYALGSSLLLLLLGLITRRLLVDNFGPQITTASQVVSQLFNFFSIAEFGVGSVISYRLYEQIAAKNEEKISKYMSMYKWAYRVVGMVIAGLALIGAAFIAGHWLTGRAARRNLPALGFMTFVYGVTALFLLLISPLAGGLRVTGESLYGIVVLAVACTLGGHALMTYLLGFVSADVVSFALLAEPIGAAVWALVLFHEQVTFPLLVGGLTVIVGLMLYTYGEMKAGKQ